MSHETAAFHPEADREVDVLFLPHVTVEQYRSYLVRSYGFEAPLEAALALSPPLDKMLDLRARARAGLIAQDLLRLGLRPPTITDLPLCLTVPQFRSLAEALGWMYVTERAALAHPVLCRHLQTCLPEPMVVASAYLHASGGTLGTRWRQFGAVLDEVAGHPAIADRIVVSACEAFRCHRRWLLQEQREYLARSVV